MPNELSLVTGGAGYFGGALVPMLAERGDRIRLLDLHEAEECPEDAEQIICDIRDAAAVHRACEDVSTIFHCVAQVPLAKDRKLLWSVNLEGTRNMLQSALACGVRKVVFISSSAVYGVPETVPITLATPTNPAEAYGKAKCAAEQLCREYVRQGLDVTIVRPRTIMGHGRLGIMQLIFEWVSQGHNVFVLGSGDNRYQFVHADDLALACLSASKRPGAAEYNIGAEEFGTMRETLEGLVAHAGTASRVRSLPYRPTVAAMQVTSWLRLSPLAAYHHLVYGKDVFFDIQTAKQDLAWQPRWSNIDMFVQSYDWYVAHRDEILQSRGRSLHRSPIREGILRMLRWM